MHISEFPLVPANEGYPDRRQSVYLAYLEATRPFIDILVSIEQIRGFVITVEAGETEKIEPICPPEIESFRQRVVEAIRYINETFADNFSEIHGKPNERKTESQ